MGLLLFSLLVGLAVAQECVVDLVFVQDGSGSITPGDWQQDLKFILTTIDSLNVSANGAHVGIVQFAVRLFTHTT